MDWWQGDLAPFDLETTSADPNEARIVQIHLAGVTNLMNPGVEIPEAATAVHGITSKMVESADPPWVALPRLFDQLVDLADRGVPLVGHNLSYDLTVVDREFHRLDDDANMIDVGTLRLPEGLLVMDTFVLDKQVDPYRKGSRKLVDVARNYGVVVENAHDAGGDAEMAVQVFRAIAARHPEIGMRPPFVVHHQQVQWAWAQRKSLEEWLRRTDPNAIVDPHWPVQPWHERTSDGA